MHIDVWQCHDIVNSLIATVNGSTIWVRNEIEGS